MGFRLGLLGASSLNPENPQPQTRRFGVEDGYCYIRILGFRALGV